MSQGVGPATDNPVKYISHHLEPLQAGSGFWTFNIDTMFFSTLIMFGVMFAWFPSGLVLYWLTNMFIQIIQQWWYSRTISSE